MQDLLAITEDTKLTDPKKVPDDFGRTAGNLVEIAFHQREVDEVTFNADNISKGKPQNEFLINISFKRPVVNATANNLASTILSKGGFSRAKTPPSIIAGYKLSNDKKHVFICIKGLEDKKASFFTLSNMRLRLVCIDYDQMHSFFSNESSAIYNEGGTGMSKPIARGRTHPIIVRDRDEETGLHPVFSEAVNTYFDVTDKLTRETLLGLNEAEQDSILTSLTSKLYDNMVAKVDNIDYGDIPNTKGDFTKLPNYAKLVETVDIMHDLIKQYRQPTNPIDEVSEAIQNVVARTDLFVRGYKLDVEFVMVTYCNICLAIITSVSYLIASCIEFVKTPNGDTFEIVLDKLAYNKAREHLLFDCLKKFNNSCRKREFDKAMEAVLKTKAKSFTGVEIGVGIGVGIAITALILNIIPILRELIFFFYYTRMRVSDFFDIQADLLQVNAYNVEHNEARNPDERKRIADKQYHTVEMFRKISNFFAVSTKKAEIESDKEVKQAKKKKMKLSDVTEDTPDSAASTLF